MCQNFRSLCNPHKSLHKYFTYHSLHKCVGKSCPFCAKMLLSASIKSQWLCLKQQHMIMYKPVWWRSPTSEQSPLVTHRSPERPEGWDSGFDCLIDLLQTVRQSVPAKLRGRGSISGRGGGRWGERWQRGRRELRRNETKVPSHEH